MWINMQQQGKCSYRSNIQITTKNQNNVNADADFLINYTSSVQGLSCEENLPNIFSLELELIEGKTTMPGTLSFLETVLVNVVYKEHVTNPSEDVDVQPIRMPLVSNDLRTI